MRRKRRRKRKRKRKKKSSFCIFAALLLLSVFALAQSAEKSVDEVACELSNPVGSTAMLPAVSKETLGQAPYFVTQPDLVGSIWGVFFQVTPDLQFVFNPSLHEGVDALTCFGIRGGITL